MRNYFKISAICLFLFSFMFSLPVLASTSTTEVLQRALSSSTPAPTLNSNATQLAARCMRWRRVCRSRCVRWLSRGASRCWLCSRYANLRYGGAPIGRLVTCHYGWKRRAENRGWHCVRRHNPRGIDRGGRHCVTWRPHCRHICVRWR